MIKVGPAGWSYPDWDGKVWPRDKPRGFHGLPFLARFVSCMEVNSSFYALPKVRTCARWADLLQPFPGFPVIMKLHQSFTHAPWQEEQASADAEQFLQAIRPLEVRRHLAGILVQFPISFLFGRSELLRLGRIRHLFEGKSLILEVRHRSWFEKPALNALRGLGYSLASIDLPDAWNHPPAEFDATGPIGYLRLHGRNDKAWFSTSAGRDDKYNYLYSKAEVGQMAYRADALAKNSDATFVVTNNHFQGKAVANAMELRYLLEGREKVAAPASLVHAYPHLAEICVAQGQGRLF